MALLNLLDDLSGLQLISLALAVYVVAFKIIYPFVFSPVRHVPGPWYARVSQYPLLYATFKRRRTEYVTKILGQYGPVAVIAPDTVHTTDEEAMKIIYDRSSIKTSFYSSMGKWKGTTSTLGFVDYASASPSRNNLIQCFQNRNLAILAENIESHIDNFIHLLEESVVSDSPVDGIVAFRLLALDIVTDVLWGETNTLLTSKVHGSDETPVFLRRFHAFSTWNATKSFLPGVDFFVRTCGNKKWRGMRNDCNDMDITAHEALERWQKKKHENGREKDVLTMLQSMNKASAPAVPPEEVPAYMVEMLAAGSSTTSHTAAFVCWVLARHPDAHDRLREELTGVFPDLATMDIKLSIGLPYLNGVIHETMRLYPMIPGPLQRYLANDTVIAGKMVPKGVIASTAAYNQGRLEAVYPSPDSFKPERWLEPTDRMKLNWTPFGYGSRACPGSNLAMTELKYMIAKIFRKFRSVIPPDYENDVLELSDVFAAGSKSGHCWLKFVEASGEKLDVASGDLRHREI